MVQIGIGNVILNTGNLYGHPLAVQDAVSLALFFMVADQGANDAQGIVVEAIVELFYNRGYFKLKKHMNGFIIFMLNGNGKRQLNKYLD